MRIRVDGEKDIWADGGGTLRELLQKHGVYVDSPCGGAGVCGKCLVQFRSGAPSPTAQERERLTEEQLAAGVRLACCTAPQADCEIALLWNFVERMAVETGFYLQTPGKAAGNGGSAGSAVGAAVDLGTTTIAMALVRLADGARLASATMVNHQRMYGADVISRIHSANEGRGELLKNLVRKDIACGLDALLEDAAAKGEDVCGLKNIVIAGNTAMCHLLQGYSCGTLGVAPFVPVDISLTRCIWKFPVGNPLLREADTVILPGISAFVGADIAAGILSTGMAESSELSMLIDMGTNSEMVIGNRNGFLVTSAAAGPAFEGGRISCGMAGVPGAVSHVVLEGGKARCETIGKEKAVGICGTGIVDAVSELAAAGLVDENGLLSEPYFSAGFPLAENVRVTQEDIREIQMAKSAIRAGIEILLREYGAAYGHVRRLYLAGGFGLGMNPASAAGIGLIPPELSDRVIPVGNTALAGACEYLCGPAQENGERMRHIVENSREINLAMHPDFNELYLQYMFFEKTGK